MTIHEAQRVIDEAWAEYARRGRPYGPVRLALYRWLEEGRGIVSPRLLELALHREAQHLCHLSQNFNTTFGQFQN